MSTDDTSDVPEGWSRVPIAAVVRHVSNIKPEDEPERTFHYVDISSIDNVRFRIVDPKRILGAGAPSRARRPIQAGDVLFSNVRTYLRNIAVVTNGLTADVCSTGFTVLRPTDAVLPSYLFRFVLTKEFIDCVTPEQTGTHYPATSDRVVMSQSIPLPPLAEQHRIVAAVEQILAKVSSARERLERVPATLKRFRQAVLAAACSGSLTADWREHRPGDTADELIQAVQTRRRSNQRKRKAHSPMLRTDLELTELPRGWRWVDLRFLMSEEEAYCYGVVQPGEHSQSGNYLIRAGDIASGHVDTGSLRRITYKVDEQYSRSRLQGGELLVTVVGAGIGDVAIVPQHCAGFNIARAVAKVPIRDADAGYVYRWVQTSQALTWLVGDAREVARPTLNLEQLETLPVPLPPVPEQKEIARRVSALIALADRIEAKVTAARKRVDTLTQAVLAKAFRGELVPTEAELAARENRNYESATELLMRIRSAASTPAKNRRVRREVREEGPPVM